MADQKEGHREYAAERRANIIRLTEDLRGSDALRTEFVDNADQTATKYGLRLTEDEVSALTAIAANEELDIEALAAVAGGAAETNNGCNGGCNVCG